jgi:hypothetical protein
MSYEVLYNTCYGGFGFPNTFIDEVFRSFPPESEEGKELWKPTKDSFIAENDPVPEGRFVQRIVNTEEFCHGYKWIYYESINKTGKPSTYQHSLHKRSRYCTKDFTNIYYVNENNKWRTSPTVIHMARKHNLIGVKHGCTELNIARVPMHYTHYIKEYDGMESVKVECPTEQILVDLLKKIQEESHEVHPLTQQLLDGVPVREVLYKSAEYENDSD